MRRVVVVGSSGSGKTTTARRLAAALGVESLELDAVFHGPGWRPRPELLRETVDRVTQGPTWVVDGSYEGVTGGVARERADTVVWLDPPRWRVMAQSVRRAVRRASSREELWNGNRETWRMLLSLWDEEKSILRWAWNAYPRSKARYAALMAEAVGGDVAYHRLRRRRDVDDLVAAVSTVPDADRSR